MKWAYDCIREKWAREKNFLHSNGQPEIYFFSVCIAIILTTERFLYILPKRNNAGERRSGEVDEEKFSTLLIIKIIIRDSQIGGVVEEKEEHFFNLSHKIIPYKKQKWTFWLKL